MAMKNPKIVITDNREEWRRKYRSHCLRETVRKTNQALNRLGEAFSEFAKVWNHAPNNRP